MLHVRHYTYEYNVLNNIVPIICKINFLTSDASQLPYRLMSEDYTERRLVKNNNNLLIYLITINHLPLSLTNQ